ncbi:DUF2243 domain-containing protein [Jiangella ureilytica]|uniref:DUF2243 domain-containing protein n=1 Tax=Jiangella ureilytica TaxID=2530374 RepID=A0A4R4RNN2_9ACTN|nr:DUF2243 domain-containing protein [Jiangella ureilytica]TDC51066.1 DUF2243 domain-containing protein [Jiangella ureilytica]
MPGDDRGADRSANRSTPRVRPSLVVGAMIGAALMAAVDEIVFHQLLGWHHFYDRSSSDVALFSDGVLHAAELVLLVAGFTLLAGLHRRHDVASGAAWAGVLLGAGVFQLWDGVVDHKVLRVHQVRYGVDLLPYDVVWNLAGAVLVAAGAALAWRQRRREAPARPEEPRPR